GGRELNRLSGKDAPVYSVAFSPDGASVAAAGLDKTVHLWDVGSAAVKLTLTGHPDHIYHVAFNPSGTRLLSVGYGGNLMIWDLAAGKPSWTHKLPMVAYFAVYSPDGARIVVGGADGNAYLVELPEAAR
ncbi:MAG: WD40 repeat domain-containing protein, partial [Candidatus Saccharimonadales bacterium]